MILNIGVCMYFIVGVAVDNTYCGLNSTAITTSSFWSVTVGKVDWSQSI